jgi:hypothetical protein
MHEFIAPPRSEAVLRSHFVIVLAAEVEVFQREEFAVLSVHDGIG